YLVAEALHVGEHAVEGRCRHAEVEARYTGLAHGADISGDGRGVTGEEPPRAIGCLRRLTAPGDRAAVAEGEGFRIAALFLEQDVQPGHGRAVAVERVERVLWVRAARIAALAELRRAAQRRCALAADPEGRMRLLHGLRREQDIVELHMLALEARAVLGPELLEGGKVFIGGLAARVEGRCADGLELLLQPAGTAAD